MLPMLMVFSPTKYVDGFRYLYGGTRNSVPSGGDRILSNRSIWGLRRFAPVRYKHWPNRIRFLVGLRR